MFVLVPFAFSLLSWSFCVVASNDCQPSTWPNPPEARGIDAATIVAPRMIAARQESEAIQPGDINCRFWDRTYDDANYYSCTKLANKWAIPLAWFFKMNPTLLPDCSNIEPNTLYCVTGFIEPLRSPDGFCGPQHNNAVCAGTDAQCCNSETWTCGNSEEDCADGTCYEGLCAGDKVYSTDGTCGSEHGNRLCAGKWGDCCNRSGQCGTGADFCGESVCQSGNCDWPWLRRTTTVTSSASSTSSSTVSRSSTSTSTSTSTRPLPMPSSSCSDGTGAGGLAGLCSWACSHGFCPDPCTCTPGTPAALPPPTGDRGYALLDLRDEPGFSDLCDFVCSYAADYCPEQVCTKTPYSTVQQPGTVCVQGEGEGGYAGLCSYACHYGYCPSSSCTCTLYGAAIQEPPILGTPGEAAPGVDDSYDDLCNYTCNHGYCPTEVCAYST